MAFLARQRLDANPLYSFTSRLGKRELQVHGIAHRFDGLLILELEQVQNHREGDALSFASLVRGSVDRLQRAPTLQELAQAISREVRQLSGFDRVVVYRFAADQHGAVIAEDSADGMEPWLGLHYPASDIPAQARALYASNWLRLIPNARYTPQPLVPRHNPSTGRPLDMRYCVLRSVSPVHCEYLHNLGSQAAMSISIMRGEALWGLVSCHHRTPYFVPYDLRTACEFLGQVFSLLLVGKENAENFAYELRLKAVHAQFVERMAGPAGVVQGLTQSAPNLRHFVQAGGAALAFDNQLVLLGTTPTREQVTHLIDWLAMRVEEDVYATDSLPRHYPPAGEYQDVASGVLALAISPRQKQYVLWFRPEQERTVHWAGNPTKPVESTPDGTRLTPRTSFALWKETVHGTSWPWLPCEIEAATALRQALVTVVLRQAEQMARVNAELRLRNDELESFAYVASHDLKEPLRGIHNYAQFLLEDYAAQLDAEGRQRLYTMQRLTHRMDSLLDSLLHFSRVGRVDFNMVKVDLDEVLQQSLELVADRLREMGAAIHLHGSLGVVRCDPLHIQEVFANLLSNAAKYNDKPEKHIEIGVIPAGDGVDGVPAGVPVFYVRDNGIGIAGENVPSIFQIFRRLHARDAYGGGTGTGLTIAKRIIERHGGLIWVESTPGRGSTFYFTLQEGPEI